MYGWRLDKNDRMPKGKKPELSLQEKDGSNTVPESVEKYLSVKTGMNSKTPRYFMGHSDIGVTPNTYARIQFDDTKQELLRAASR